MKQKGKVEIKRGSLTPTKRGLWHYASEKLSEAKRGMQQMENATDRVAFESGWILFVDSIEEFWTSFMDEGKEKFSSFQSWMGNLIKQRKDDDLLSYLYQARHQSQHGRLPLDWQKGSIGIPQYYGGLRDLKIYPNGSFEVDTYPLGDTHNKVKVVHDPGKPLLATITNKKYKQVFYPPKSHLRKSIDDRSPLHAARLGIDFYENVLEKAFTRFGAE